MSYIGQGLPADTFQGFVTDSFTGDGSATTFTLSKEPFSEDTLIVVINNVIQKPTTNFTVSGTTLTIVGTAVADGDVIYAIHMGGPLPVGGASELDLNGASDKLILDTDADTTISADTDDQIDFKAGGTDIMSLTATTVTINDGTTIITNDNSDTLTLQSADADASEGPVMVFDRASSSPADDDVIGAINFRGRDSGGNGVDYVKIQAEIMQESDGSEDGQLQFNLQKAGTSRNILTLDRTTVTFNEDSQDIDFRVESTNHTHFLNVNSNDDRLFIGNNLGTNIGQGQRIQLMGNSQQSSGMSMMCAANDSNGPSLEFLKSRNTSIGSRTVVQDDDLVGRMLGRADDGTDMNSAVAEIRFSIDGSPGSNDTPGRITFYTTPDSSASLSERLRLTSGGDFLVGTTAFAAGQTSTNITPSQIFSSRETTGAAGHISFQNPNGGVGGISTSGSATAYNTSSDYRLKENVNYSWDATTELKKLKPAKFNFKTDSDTTVEGFLAHEVSDIVPLAVTGEKDATANKTNVVLSPLNIVIAENISKEKWEAGKLSTTDDNGNTVDPLYANDTTWSATHTEIIPQSIDQSKLVPLMVKTIQELEARIKTLEDA